MINRHLDNEWFPYTQSTHRRRRINVLYGRSIDQLDSTKLQCSETNDQSNW